MTIGRDGRSEPEFRPLDLFRWVLLPVGISGMSSTAEVVDAVAAGFSDSLSLADGQAMGVRVELTGETCLHEILEAESIRLTDELRCALSLNRPDDSGSKSW